MVGDRPGVGGVCVGGGSSRDEGVCAVFGGTGKGSGGGTLTDDSLKALRRGWYLGDQSFGTKLLAKMKPEVAEKRRKGSLRGEVARAHGVAEAELD